MVKTETRFWVPRSSALRRLAALVFLTVCLAGALSACGSEDIDMPGEFVIPVITPEDTPEEEEEE